MKQSAIFMLLFSFQLMYGQVETPSMADSLKVLTEKKDEFRKLSVELSIGHSAALIFIESQDFGINHFKGAVRYMFTESFGLRAACVFSNYTPTEVGKVTSKMGSGQIELVYNVGRGLKIVKGEDSKFALLAHAGAGYGTHASPGFNYTNAERFVPLTIGLTPTFLSGNGLSLFFDIELLNNRQQDVRFDGQFVEPSLDYDAQATGIALNMSLGLSLSFGGPYKHADFYQKKMAINQ